MFARQPTLGQRTKRWPGHSDDEEDDDVGNEDGGDDGGGDDDGHDDYVGRVMCVKVRGDGVTFDAQLVITT